MKTKLSIALLLSISAGTALAADYENSASSDLLSRIFSVNDRPSPGNPGGPGGPGAPQPGQPHELPPPCKAINPTEGQIKQVQEALKRQARTNVGLESALKLAGMDLVDTVTNISSTRDQANAASENVSKALGDIFDSKASLELDILYSILNPEQREPAFMCFRILKRGHAPGRISPPPHPSAK